MQEKLNSLKSMVKEMSNLVDDMIKSSNTESNNTVIIQNQNTETTQQSNVVTTTDFESDWNYGYWKEAKKYDDIKSALIEAQKNKRPVLIALSKPTGCTNCKTYWRNVTCDGVLGHDDSCVVAKKNHPIVNYAKEHKIVMLYISTSKFPNIQNKIMGKEYDKYLHKPTYYPIYLVVSVKDNIDLREVPANDKLLNVGTDDGDTVNFIMGYIGISGKPVLDCDGNQTSLKVKTDSTGWNVFKSNIETIFSDTSKTYGIVL